MSLRSWLIRRLGGEPTVERSAYEMGRTKRTDPNFLPPSIGPNALADQTLGLVVRRSRYLNEVHPTIANAQQIVVNNTVGCGYWPEPNTGYPDLDKAIRTLWVRMEGGADVGREHSVYDRQRLFAKEVFAAGECLMFTPMAKAWRGYPAAPAMELIEQERLDLGLSSLASGQAGVPAGSRVRQSVEFDSDGRRTAYHVLVDHPNDGGSFAFAPVLGSAGLRRLSAMDATLGFVMRRVGQVRGVPWMVSVGETTRMEEGFHEAFILQAKIMACLATFIKTGSANAKLLKAFNEGAAMVDAMGNPVTMIEPGLIGILPKDAEVNMQSPNAPSPTMAMAEEILLRRMASGLNISYSDLARDYSKSTFSSERASTLADRKGYRPFQKLCWHACTRPYYEKLVAWAVLTGEIKLTAEQVKAFELNPQQLYQCSVIFEGWEWVNPQQEAQAAEIELGIGITSIKRLAASRGAHWQDIIDEQLECEAYEQRERQRLGLGPRQAAPVRAEPKDPDPKKDAPQDEEAAPAGRRSLRVGGTARA